jgi:isoamylase
MAARFRLRRGQRFPAGATDTGRGVNFSIFSRNATAVELLLFEHAEDRDPIAQLELDPKANRTFFFWHVFIAGARPGLYYSWRVHGPQEPAAGFRFDPSRELLDPWARNVSTRRWNRRAAIAGRPDAALRAQVVPSDGYDWEGDRPLNRPLKDAVIYELHVRGFTRDPSSGCARPGTFRALIDKIPYLEALGVTHVELLPVMAFDADDVPARAAERGLVNYWGYSPYGFFAPHPGYAAGDDARAEFRDMVKALHRAGIGVILDVVLNHTAEGNEHGPVINFKGMGNEFFYHLDPDDRSRYRDFTGCGNTINCNHPLVARFLLQCLEFWVRDMHVDGFRLDLASVLSRGEDGEPMYHAPVLWNIEFSDILQSTTLIAEAWDAAGLYQVGDFPGFRWSEWNGRYRDVLRRFLRGEAGLLGELATRIAGSSDFYADAGRQPANGINFVTCHDGFTLWDLVSYDDKHNEANGEDNRDGTNENYSWNSGAEGETDDEGINALRAQRARNFIALLMVSQGVPMLLAGDEVLRTQRGNNNAYCQDNALGWFDWRRIESHADMLRFTRGMVALRRRHAGLRREHFVAAEPDDGREPAIVWRGETLEAPDWNDPEARVLCFTVAGIDAKEGPVHVMANMSAEAKALPLPPAGQRRWHRIADTKLAPPDDFVEPEAAVALRATHYTLAAQAVAVFEAR